MKKIDESNTRMIGIILTVIFLLAAALRLFHLNYQSLWYDEFHSIIPTHPDNTLKSIIDYAKDDQPPLFFLYLHAIFKVFGYNEIIGRLASAAIGLLGIASLYALGKECQGKAVGLFAALITSVCYYHIYYSQELRFYSMCFLFSVLSYLFFIRAFKRNRVIDFLGYTVFTVCLMYTHYYGLVIFCTQALTFLFLLRYKKDIRFILASVISGIVIALAYTPWIPIIVRDSGIQEFWIKRPGPFFVAIFFYDYTGKDAFTSTVFLVLLFFFIRTVRDQASHSAETRGIYLILILWTAFSYFLPYLWSIFRTPLLHDRYTIVTLPALLLMFAIGWDTINNVRWRYSIPVLLVISAIINLGFIKQHYTRLQKDQFREAAQVVKSSNTEHFPVYSGLPWHFNFYFRDTPDQVKDLREAREAGAESFWLLQAHYTTEEMEAELLALEPLFEVVEKHALFGANAVLLRRK